MAEVEEAAVEEEEEATAPTTSQDATTPATRDKRKEGVSAPSQHPNRNNYQLRT
ncbi:hypothetical protein [Rothia nasimurium]|uniref:hypothetical protein n=1 Tax=Rothia nasimurium TaxID=85336 RepID=UPI001F1DE525|nr:hypothetical protein [Rothia nasimurium]